jgi:hypothetical protein
MRPGEEVARAGLLQPRDDVVDGAHHAQIDVARRAGAGQSVFENQAAFERRRANAFPDTVVERRRCSSAWRNASGVG